MRSTTNLQATTGMIGIAITLTLALVAELFRFHGVLLLDLWVPIFTFSYLGWLTFRRELQLPTIAIPAALFTMFGAASLLINSNTLGSGEFIQAAFYGIRWFSMFLLSVVIFNQKNPAQNPKNTAHNFILWMLFIFALLVSIAGFIQLQITPDFTAYEALGWDPHIGRLLSTWFDPNFVGGFLAFMIPLIAGTAIDKPTWRKHLIPLAIILVLALGLTLSRSSYLALITGLFVFGLIKSKKLLILGFSLLLITTIFSPPIQTRIESLVDSAQSVFTENYTLPDQSSRLRFESWQIGWELFKENPIIGQGYNRYKEAALEQKLITDLNSHSASGSDSSLITILATTGLAGFIPFLGLYLILALQAWKYRNQGHNQGYSAGFFSALCGLFVHCIFVNSLLFPLFMAPFWLAAGLLPPLEFRQKD